MPILTMLIVLFLAGVLLWFVNSNIAINGKIKSIINVVVVVVVIVWLMKVLGLISYIKDMHL